MDDLYETIASIIQDKKEAKRLPAHAMIEDIIFRCKSDDLQEELDALEAIGLVYSGRTINSIYYLLNDSK